MPLEKETYFIMEGVTPFRVSTITATASLNTFVDLDVLYDNLCISNSKHKITFVEYGKKKNETVFKGFSKKFLIDRRIKTKNTRFDNQVTVVFKDNINMKIFPNGNIQMTGIKDISDGRNIVNVLIELIKDIYNNGHHDVVECITNIQNVNYLVRLINTDYRVGFDVKRDTLYKVMQKNYEHLCSYEPCIYPGVKIQFYWNIENPTNDGICHCRTCCSDRKKSGSGKGNGDCRKVTIAVFQSGCVIITGSQDLEQVQICYNFINDILFRHREEIEKKPLLAKQKKEIKKVYVKKSAIIRPYLSASQASHLIQ